MYHFGVIRTLSLQPPSTHRNDRLDDTRRILHHTPRSKRTDTRLQLHLLYTCRYTSKVFEDLYLHSGPYSDTEPTYRRGLAGHVPFRGDPRALSTRPPPESPLRLLRRSFSLASSQDSSLTLISIPSLGPPRVHTLKPAWSGFRSRSGVQGAGCNVEGAQFRVDRVGITSG